MAKKVHMVTEVRAAEAIRSHRDGSVLFRHAARADTICGTTTRSLHNATDKWARVTCHYCLKHKPAGEFNVQTELVRRFGK